MFTKSTHRFFECGKRALTLATLVAVFTAMPADLVAQQPAAASPQPADELRQAYKKEYAFLTAQKRELERRIAAFKKQASGTLGETEVRIDGLQDHVLRMETRAQSLQDQVVELERQRLDTQQNADILRATFQQASVTFSDQGVAFMEGEDFQKKPEHERLEILFTEGTSLLGTLSQVREEPGRFYTMEGDEVEGSIVRYGAIASYGVSEKIAGILVPAGGGQLKLWREPNQDTARILAAGQVPPTVPIFIYGSRDGVVDTSAKDGALETVQKGGLVAWLIMVLALFALILIAARIIFLRRASASTEEIVGEVGGLVQQRKIDQAIDVCKHKKGSTPAVVAAALRNLHRDRESLDDIINESILHESSRLERFGTMILVIAAVAPLLGLLGTVTGMITTFEIITEHGTGDPKLLSGGISVALITTELGLIVAIPALLIGNMLSGWADRIKDDMEKAALRVINLYERFLPKKVEKAA